MTSLQLDVDSVKSAVSSTSTCTTATVALLGELLTCETSNTTSVDIGSTATSRRPLKPTTNAQGKPRKPSATETARAAKNKASEKSITSTPQLSQRERAILATEVINRTIKALDSTIKAPAEIKRPITSTQPKKTHARQALRRSSSAPGTPLTSRTLERVISSPSIPTRASRSSSATSHEVVGSRCVAECARLAFACLRSMQAAKVACVDLPALRLENGMSALIGKLITLGLDDLAGKELKILKRRLDQLCGPQSENAAKRPTTTSKSSASAEPPSLVDLLEFSNPPAVNLASIAISTQLQALKLIAARKRPQLVATTLAKLLSDCPGSPIELILQAAKHSTVGSAKAAKQLDTLSNLILSLAPNASASEDLSGSSKASLDPEVAFQSHCLAYTLRTKWWNLCGHQPDLERELLDPLSRCMSSFARRHQCKPISAYSIVEAAFQNIEALVSSVKPGSKSSLTSVYKILSSLAQEAGLYEQAAHWTKYIRDIYTRAVASDVQLCAIAARLVALKLQSTPQDEEIEGLMMSILDGIQGPLKGESKELDEMVLDVTTARKAAISIISDRMPQRGRLSSGAQQMCESLILVCPRFTLRYLGKSPVQGATPRSIIAYEQRQKLVSRFVCPTVDSCLYLLKTYRNKGTLTWDLLDSTLQDCLALANATGDQLSDPVDNSKPSSSYLVKISHLYYVQHVDYQQDGESAKDTLRVRALRRSIDAVENGSSMEKLSANTTSKLERLSSIYASLGRFDDARATTAILLDDMVDSGVLSVVAQVASSKTLQAAWMDDVNYLTLARAIVSLVRLEVRIGSKSLTSIIGRTEHLSAEEKGVFLEQVLEALASQSKDVSALSARVSSDLLLTYTAKEYPLRRLRVLVQLLLCGNENGDLKDDVRNTIAIINIEMLLKESKDVGLERYARHLKAFALSNLELRENHPRIELMRQHLETWSTILDECNTIALLSNSIDDTTKLIHHFNSISDFLDLTGSGVTRIAVLKMIAVLNEITTSGSTPDDLIFSYSTLGIQYLHLGYSGKAGLALDKAHIRSQENGASIGSQLRYNIAHSEYLLAIGNSERCESVLINAQEMTLQYSEAFENLRRGKDKYYSIKLLADAAMIHSMLALQSGALPSALIYARRCTKLVYRLWDLADRQSKTLNLAQSSKVEHPKVDDASEVDPSTIILVDKPSVEQSTPGPAFWPMIPALFRSLSWLSGLYAHLGMYQETLYYAEQAQKVVQAVGPGVWSAAAMTLTGNVWLKAGTLDKAAEMLDEAKQVSTSISASTVSAITHLRLAKLHGCLGNKQGQLEAYCNAQSVVDELMDPKFIRNLDRVIDPAAALEDEMLKLAIAPLKRPTARKAPPRGKVTAKKIVSKSKVVVECTISIHDECLGLRSLKGDVLRQKAQMLLLSKRRDEALEMLESSKDLCSGTWDSLEQLISSAKHLMFQGVHQMAADPVYSMLQDSTISFPSIVGATSSSDFSHKLSPPKKTKASVRSKSPSGTGFCDKLCQAQDHLMEAYILASRFSLPTSTLQSISSMLNATILLISTASASRTKTSIQPGFATYSIEMSRNNAHRREMGALSENSSTNADDFKWPSVADMTHDITDTSSSLTQDVARFQREYINIIPSTWSALSISLSENKQDLCITKMQAGHTPFVLRLPLGRNNSRDVDEEVFDFEQGRDELREIIEQANESAHGARDITGRGGKTAWWNERDALDLRMKELLENIEKIWLGGFKGIFSEHNHRPDLLARFQRSFQNILDKHLPSRQKSGRKAKATQKVTLDPRILDLFIGLGDPSAPGAEFDEPLTDLLYFIIDILQFHGERNAYDEIDFDSVVVETHDALCCYYEALLSSSTSKEERHTILVLDKALHAFPWESLPCMDGLPVSRMPSLSCLRDRILAQQETAEPGRPEGHYVSRSAGSYILNPSGDLSHTESTFGPLLEPLSLPHNHTINNRAPTEEEFSDILTQSSYLLYFGHGSGTQYIRPKTIRRLPSKPAVVFLMGCSSGALIECGEFEPFGTPINYLLAGSPAIVANLWDVTDRDCDRFATAALERWGLFDEKNGKGKGKGKNPERGDVSLVRAVAEARSKCQYRYLTAAAVCVYGIPVYFK